MKHTDGLFHQIFNEVSAEYPEIENEHYIIDIGSAVIADQPERFDVIVTLNLYGDIVSDITAQIAGSVGLGGSANVGEHIAMFEAIHGSAPDIAGKDIANPSGLINGACMMLNHIGKAKISADIQNALLKTLEDGVHTADLFNEQSTRKVGTQAFADAVIEQLGQKPESLKAVEVNENAKPIVIRKAEKKSVDKKLVGVDVFIDWDSEDRNPNTIGEGLSEACIDGMKLKMITNRGVKVYPSGFPETFCTDHWRCRFVAEDHQGDDRFIAPKQVISLLDALSSAGFDFIKTEHLYEMDGQRAYSLGQGE